jgi:hypothetical protein
MTASSRNGSVAVYLPRSFHGFLTLSSANGSIVFSDAVSPNVTTFSHVTTTKRCFMGDLTAVPESGEWSGDELVANSHNGKVKVFYVDEIKSAKPRAKSSIFSRIFRS